MIKCVLTPPTHCTYYWLLFHEIRVQETGFAPSRSFKTVLFLPYKNVFKSWNQLWERSKLHVSWDRLKSMLCDHAKLSAISQAPAGSKINTTQITKNRNNHYFKSFFFIAAYLLPVILSLWNITTSSLRDIVVTSQVIWHATTTSDKHGYHRPLLWITW